MTTKTWLCTTALVCGHLLAAVSAAAAPSAEVCSGSVVVWDHKVRKADREELKVEARVRAFQDLAAQASVRASVVSTDRKASWLNEAEEGTFQERFLSLTTSRSSITITELLHGGEYRYDGNKKRMGVRYCLPQDQFQQARSEIEQEWARIEDQLRDRFADLERAIRDDDLSYASELFPALKSDVSDLVMDREDYTSVLTGKKNTFKGWLELWSDQVRSDRAYASYCVNEARILVDDARLEKAQNFVDEAIKTDRRYVPALELGRTIDQRWSERAQALQSAVSAASVGKESKANRQLEFARSIDREEAVSYGDVRTRVNGLLASFKEDNPRWTVGIDTAYGTLGADPKATYELYADSGYYYDVRVSRPLMLGLTGRVRIGRFLQTWISGSYGTAQASFSSWSEGFMTTGNLKAGFGYRSIRNAGRKMSFQAGAGIAQENAKIKPYVSGLDNQSDSRLGYFARLAIEGRNASFWVEHGFGFKDDNEYSPIVWSDSWMVGFLWSFH